MIRLVPSGHHDCAVCAGRGLAWAGPWMEPCLDCHPAAVPPPIACTCMWRDGQQHAPRCPKRMAA